MKTDLTLSLPSRQQAILASSKAWLDAKAKRDAAQAALEAAQAALDEVTIIVLNDDEPARPR